MKTVSIEFWAGQLRGGGPNNATRIAAFPPAPAAVGTFDVRAAFVEAYARFAPVCRAVDEPGVAVLAIDEVSGMPAGIVCVRARVDRHVVAIVGRHDRCDLFLASKAALALRQLAVVVSPVRSWGAGSSDVTFRILDLRTTDGMRDEEHRELRGLRAEGAAIVRCAGYLVLALPLGDATDWPASGADAWAYLPERVYFDELVHPADGSAVHPPAKWHRSDHTTVVTRTHGPREPGMQLVVGDDLAGTLQLAGPESRGTLAIGHAALRDGVLLGRYARCNGAALASDGSLSRVHALLLQADDRLLMIDTASSFGTRRVGDADARVLELTSGSELELATETRVRWTWTS
ncbi:MAG: hypothetical protein M3680_21460 [Myxococcota bacterium]|nr:hypothetical protein [Myxococcota bacterium]